ncbi:MAG: NmrA family transcriptional regulator [Pseudonocardia sp. SCN 72-86]|nr:MAG: NmrA family transcriptional regulator [Pseudonocardia sp. SCN 72-86]
MNIAEISTVFVAGGTGKTGRRVAARLQARGIGVRVGSRGGRDPFDWHRPDTWAAAIGDADAAYIAYAPDLAVPGADTHVGAFARVAVTQGVRRIVLLSGRGEPEAQVAEQAVLAEAPDATVLRASWMAQNFSEGDFVDLVRSGTVTLPVGTIGEPFVDVDDIADAAVAILTGGGHEGWVHELTGPRLLTFADTAAEIAAATGRDITFTTVDAADFTAALTADGVPADEIDLLRYLFAEVLDGRNAHLGTGVQDCLGRPARDFREFAAEAARTGVWNA